MLRNSHGIECLIVPTGVRHKSARKYTLRRHFGCYYYVSYYFILLKKNSILYHTVKVRFLNTLFGEYNRVQFVIVSLNTFIVKSFNLR